MIIWTSFQSKQ